VRLFLHVHARALGDDDGGKLGDDDDREPRRCEIQEHFADGLIKTGGDDDFSYARQRECQQKEPRAMRDFRRQGEGKPKQQERQPRDRVELKRAHERYAGAAREVARVSAPYRNRCRRAGADGDDELNLPENAVAARHDKGVPCEKAEG